VLVGPARRPARQLHKRRFHCCRREADCAARRWMSPTIRAPAHGRCQPRSRRARAGGRTASTPRQRGRRPRTALRIDREPVSSASASAIPAPGMADASMAGLFLGAASSGGVYCDRLVMAIDRRASSPLRRSTVLRSRQPAVGGCETTTTNGATRSRAKPRIGRLRWRRRGPDRDNGSRRLCARAGEASAFPSRKIMLDGWMENACYRTRDRNRGDRYRSPRTAGRRGRRGQRTLDGPNLTS